MKPDYPSYGEVRFAILTPCPLDQAIDLVARRVLGLQLDGMRYSAFLAEALSDLSERHQMPRAMIRGRYDLAMALLDRIA